MERKRLSTQLYPQYACGPFKRPERWKEADWESVVMAIIRGKNAKCRKIGCDEFDPKMDRCNFGALYKMDGCFKAKPPKERSNSNNRNRRSGSRRRG